MDFCMRSISRTVDFFKTLLPAIRPSLRNIQPNSAASAAGLLTPAQHGRISNG